MQPSSLFCRTQESHQRARAAEATLANVRGQAMVAAAAWNKEALQAEKREQRNLRKTQLAVGEALVLPLPEDRIFSENPDRGFVDHEN